MSDTVVHKPFQPHTCRIGWKEVPLPDDHHLRQGGHTSYLVADGSWDPPGTVRQCQCGRMWVGYKQKYQPGMRGMHITTTQWRPEGRFERWRRQRREAKAAGRNR